MAKYARIDANGALQGFYDSDLHPEFSGKIVMPSGTVALTDEQYQQWVTAQGALVHRNGLLVEAPPQIDDAATIKRKANLALTDSDLVILRCCEHSVAVPDEWRDYRKALREIVGGKSAELPEKPAYPAGT